jgi:sterol 3beta-glucosyltransferase
MGHLTLAALGSWGDVRPFLHLARALHRQGYEVLFLGQPEFAAAARAAGARFGALQSPVSAHQHRDLTRRLLAADRLTQAELVLLEVALREPERQLEEARRGLAGSRLLVAHHLSVLPALVAGEKGVPWVGAVLCPGLVPSTAPPLEAPDRGAAGNRLAWAMARAAVRARLEPQARGLMEPLLPAASRWRLESSFSPLLNLIAASPALSGTDSCEWDPPCAVTGHWHAGGGGRLPADLERFLELDEPPVVVTFGSMAAGEGRWLGEVCREAAQRVECRIVLQRGWAGLEAGPASNRLAYVDAVEHEALFPRARAVVHHGGAGTAHAVARSGRPSVVVTHLIDQPYWGARLQRLGCAPAPIPRAELSVGTLARALEEALGSAPQGHAATLSHRVRQENGLAAALEQIGSLAE